MRQLDAAGRQAIADAMADPSGLVRAVFSNPTAPAPAWRRVEVRPVAVQGRRLVQLTWSGVKASRSVNVPPERLAEELDEVMRLGCASCVVHTTTRTVTVRVLKRRTTVHHADHQPWAQDLSHDRQPRHLLAPERAPFLEVVGIATGDGTVRAAMQDKFRQVNEFLRIVDATLGDELPDELRVVDFGCGRAYLTFALYHYLRHVRGVRVSLDGVDADAALVARAAATAETLGWSDVRLHHAGIDEYRAAALPDLVVSLHACDTATDDAIGRAVGWDARWILAVPCCHHDVQRQLAASRFPAPVGLLRQHGILFERMGDLLTDALRAEILELCGYRVDVVEFVEREHTGRNLLLRAVRRDRPPPERRLREYEDLKRAWDVEPHLEGLVRARLAAPAGRA